MKRFGLEFLRRGIMACGLGPIVLAVLYLILRECAGLETLTVSEVCIGILSHITGGKDSIFHIIIVCIHTVPSSFHQCSQGFFDNFFQCCLRIRILHGGSDF